VLEARRRGIPVVGLQHGFIYRHWLNYLHETDEIQPSAGNPADRGFPRPDLTLLYDRFAARHLIEAGHFPAASLMVAGSPKLDAFVETARSMDDAARQALRESVGARPRQRLAVVATKYSQIAAVFDALVEAVGTMADVQLVVKCHPAENPGPYERASAGVTNVRIAPASADLARLVAAADVLITVNSTAAIEAMPLDVPALVVGLPNNLSPFVDAGAVAGAAARAEIGPTLRAVLYDKAFRDRLAQGRRTFMALHDVAADGRAAARAAEAIVRLATA
jgi:UDP-N-acetylglucosamine 2-epimerase